MGIEGNGDAMRGNQQIKQKLMIAIGAAIALGVLVFLALSGSNSEILEHLFTEKFSQEELSQRLMAFGWRGYTVIAVLAALQLICTFFPAEPVQVLAGFSFGFPVGLLCCMAGVLLGSTLIYMLQKIFGDRLRGFFIKKLNLDLEKIAKSSKVIVIIFILYFLPAIPYGMICFFAASMGMSYRRYITVMMLGALPSVCIGVSLGYVAIVSSWVVTVCIFALLILMMILIFWKKDLLFCRLNQYADMHKSTSKNRVRDVNGFIMTVIFYATQVFFFLRGIRVKSVNKVGPLERPAIVLCNHGSFIDFIYVASLLRKEKPNFVSARLYFYHKYLGWLMRRLGAFPKSMFAVDLENARNCFTVLRQKKILIIMPEARLSTAGRFEDIQENTYSFLKSANANLYTIKIGGDYLADPKWGKGFRRGSLVEVELDTLYTAEQVKSLTMEELRQAVEQRLTYDEFQWLDQHPQLHYRSRRMAEGLENILTTCPHCRKKHTLTTKKDKIHCQHCGYLTSLDDRYAFTGDFRFKNLSQWYEWQKKLLENEITQNLHYALSSKVELRLPSNGKGLTRPGGQGTCTLNRDGLCYTGTKDGQTVELHFSLQRIYRLLFGAGVNFEIYDGPEILYFVPEDKRTAVEWYMASMILYDEAFKTAG